MQLNSLKYTTWIVEHSDTTVELKYDLYYSNNLIKQKLNLKECIHKTFKASSDHLVMQYLPELMLLYNDNTDEITYSNSTIIKNDFLYEFKKYRNLYDKLKDFTIIPLNKIFITKKMEIAMTKYQNSRKDFFLPEEENGKTFIINNLNKFSGLYNFFKSIGILCYFKEADMVMQFTLPALLLTTDFIKYFFKLNSNFSELIIKNN